jgi:hypothetical protein
MADPFEQLGAVPIQASEDPFLALGGIYRDETPKDVKQAKPKSSKKDISPFMSAVTGFNTGVERLTHGIMQPLLESGFLGDNIAQGSKRTASQREADFNASSEANPWATGIGEFVGGAAPMMLVPGGVAGNMLKRVGTGMLAGAGAGAAQYVPEEGSRTLNAAFGGILGGALPLAGTAISKGYGLLKGGKDIVARNMLRGADEAESAATKEAANRLGLNITPAEASGSPIAASAQGRLGTSKTGAQALHDFGKNRLQQEQKTVKGLFDDISQNEGTGAAGIRDAARAIQIGKESTILDTDKSGINKFLTGLSPSDKDVSTEIREVARGIITKQQKTLSEKAEPLYEKARNKIVSQNKINKLMESDGTIENAITGVLNDPKYKFELQGSAPNSIKVLDLAKRRIDAQIESAKGTIASPGDRDAVRVLTDSKNRLVSTIDKLSKTYAKARSIYSEGAAPLQQLRESNIGKLADLDDTQLKSVSKIIFDPNQTNINVLSDLRDKIVSQSPETWKGIVRNEIERRLNKSSGDITGDIFYKKVLGNEADFRQFQEATKGFPDLQKQLSNMRLQFSKSSDILKQLRSTDIAKISSLDDTQLKNISKTIFDPAQTDIKVLNQLRDTIGKHDLAAWNKLVRNEMERRLDGVGDYAGSAFYDKILKSDRSFNQFLTALKGNPAAQQKLVDMRTTFKNLIEPVSAKTAARLSKSSLDVPRSTYEAALNAAKNFLGGKYDQAAIKFITSNQWDKGFQAVKKIGNRSERAAKMGALLGKISAVEAAENNNQLFTGGN